MNRAGNDANCGVDPHFAPRLSLTHAAVEVLERRQLLAVIPMGEIGLGHRVEFATPHGVNSYTFSLDKPATIDITLSNGTASIKRNGVVMSSGEKFSRPLASGSYSIEVNTKGGSSFLVKTSDFSPPTRLEADVWGGNAIRLNWDDNTDAEAYYRIDRWTRLGWRRGKYVPANYTAAVVDNLVPGAATTYRISAVTAEGVSLRSANIVTAHTASEDQSGWYRVTSLSGASKGEAGWTMHADNMQIRPECKDGTGSEWVYATSWQTAVSQVVGTTFVDPVMIKATFDGGGYTKDQIVSHPFPSGGDFKVLTAGDLRDAGGTGIPSPLDSETKLIALEDSYGGIDRDYDDFYWTVSTNFAVQPENLGYTAVVSGNNKRWIDFTWTGNSEHGESIVVEVAEQADFSDRTIVTDPTSAEHYTWKSALPGKHYYARLRASKGGFSYYTGPAISVYPVEFSAMTVGSKLLRDNYSVTVTGNINDIEDGDPAAKDLVVQRNGGTINLLATAAVIQAPDTRLAMWSLSGGMLVERGRFNEGDTLIETTDPNRRLVFDAGVDLNGNGQLDFTFLGDPENEVTRRVYVNVEEPVVDVIEVDASNPAAVKIKYSVQDNGTINNVRLKVGGAAPTVVAAQATGVFNATFDQNSLAGIGRITLLYDLMNTAETVDFSYRIKSEVYDRFTTAKITNFHSNSGGTVATGTNMEFSLDARARYDVIRYGADTTAGSKVVKVLNGYLIGKASINAQDQTVLNWGTLSTTSLVDPSGAVTGLGPYTDVGPYNPFGIGTFKSYRRDWSYDNWVVRDTVLDISIGTISLQNANGNGDCSGASSTQTLR